jgi:hypothetical protein
MYWNDYGTTEDTMNLTVAIHLGVAPRGSPVPPPRFLWPLRSFDTEECASESYTPPPSEFVHSMVHCFGINCKCSVQWTMGVVAGGH